MQDHGKVNVEVLNKDIAAYIQHKKIFIKKESSSERSKK